MTINRTKKKNIYAVILTGGSGRRFTNSSEFSLPKQFYKLLNKPLFIHSIEKYVKLKTINSVYLVINPEHEKLYDKILKKYNLFYKISKVYGGVTRLKSIINALDAIDSPGIVVLQNGSFPATSPDLIKKCIKLALSNKAVSAYMPPFYTTFEIGENRIKTPLDRKKLGFTCDPQVFEINTIKKALAYAVKHKIYDNTPTVELVTKINQPVFLVKSSHENMKVTIEADIKALEFILKKQAK
jgi:2-C-methyl-D-erythritol 4-phosphate cytidylyltransferase